MSFSFAAFLAGLVLASKPGTADSNQPNRCSVEGVEWASNQDGGVEIRARKLEATALQLESGPFVLEIGRIVLQGLKAQIHRDTGIPRLAAIEAQSAEFSGLKLRGPLVDPTQRQGIGSAPASPGAAPSAHAWSLAPLGGAEGEIHAQITDAELLFDAKVMVPIRHGQIDFNHASVEHIGPDSRMSVSRLGLYVDAVNGRSYLYKFASAPVAGVEFEQRGALLGPWVSERGKLQLQEFAESMLRQGLADQGKGLTEQARLLLGRTALSGQIQLADGLMAAPGLQMHMDGQRDGSNAIRLQSGAAARGLSAEIDSLRAGDAAAAWHGGQLASREIAAKLQLQILVEGPAMRFALDLDDGKVGGLRIDLQ